MKLSTKNISLIAIFAGLYYVMSLTPGPPIFGGIGSVKVILAALAPIYGMLLGPWLGALTAFIGAIIAWWLPPGTPEIFGLLMTACPLIGALTAGGLSTIKYGRKGWLISFAVMGLLIIGWYSTWVGASAPLYPIMHVAALIIVMVFQHRVSEMIWSENKFKRTIGVAFASYVGVMADHMTGNLIFINALGIVIPWKVIEGWLSKMGLPDVPSLFMYLLPISATERALMIIAAIIIGTTLTTTLIKAGLIEKP